MTISGTGRAPQISTSSERLVLRALAKDPALRPTMSELAIELGDLAGSLTASETVPMAIVG